jgi:hypothetical protein
MHGDDDRTGTTTIDSTIDWHRRFLEKEVELEEFQKDSKEYDPTILY